MSRIRLLSRAVDGISELLWRGPPTLYLAFRQTIRSGSRALSAISIFGITLSVSLAVGVEMASRAVTAELVRTETALSGTADLHIEAGEGGIPERILQRVRKLPGVATASPVTIASVWLKSGYQLHIVGIDFFAEHKVHGYSVRRGGVEVRDPLRLVSLPGSIVVTRPLVERFGLKMGDEIEAGSTHGPTKLTVRGILAEGGIAEAYGGHIAAMDVYLLQALLGREGLLDAIDVVFEPSAPIASTTDAVRNAVDGVARASSTNAASSLDALTGMLQRGVLVVVALAIAVSALVSYTTMAVSTDRRVAELALLQLAGLGPARVRSMVLCEAFLFGLAGAAIGTPTGALLSRAFTTFFSTVTSIVRGVEFGTAHLEPQSWGVGLLVGVGAGLAAALGPARRAADRRPVDVLEAAQAGAEPPPLHVFRLLFACAIAVGAWLQTPLPGYFRLALISGATLYATHLVVSSGARRALVAVRPVLTLVFPRIGDLVGASIAARPPRAAYTVVAVAAITAASLAISATARSVTDTVDEWVVSMNPGAARISAGTPLRLYREKLTDPTVERIVSTPGVAGYVRTKLIRTRFGGREISIVGEDALARERHGSLHIVDGDTRAVLAGLAGGQVFVSSVFVHQHGVGRGEKIVLDTPMGPQTFEIAGVVRDYSPVAAVGMTIERLDSLWPATRFRSVWVWPEGDLHGLLGEIGRRTEGMQTLSFLHGTAIEKFGTRIFERFSTLFYLMAALATLGGTLAAANLLLASVLERKRELGLLRVAGVRTRQLGASVIVDALILGAISGAVGAALSFLWTGPMLSVITEALGWELRPTFVWSHLLYLLVLVACMPLAAGLYPVWRAGREQHDLAILTD